MKRIHKGDEVIVTTGRSKGQRGHVLRTLGEEKLLVENVLKAWAEKVEPAAVERWNGSIGKIVGLKAAQ